MKKRLWIYLLAGMLLFGTTACGNGEVESDVTAKFNNSIFVGDSITEGFVFNEILPEESVIAGAGATAGFSYERIDELIEKKPDHVFIMLGSDDMLWPEGDPKQQFKKDLTKLVNRIKEELPEAKIYLQSITPVTQEALEQEPRYENIEDYNELLKELADELSVKYADIGILSKDNPDLFAEDGIHFKKEFYQLWLKKLSDLL